MHVRTLGVSHVIHKHGYMCAGWKHIVINNIDREKMFLIEVLILNIRAVFDVKRD